MSVEDSRLVLLRRVAFFCAWLVIAIIGVSSFLRLSSAGLGCSPWPSCYGHVEQAQQAGLLQTAVTPTSTAITIARFAHRVLAVLLLPLVLLLVAGGFAAKPEPWSQRWIALAALALVLFLAVLGRWTAGSRVPAVVLGNLLGGFVLFALCWRMAVGVHFSTAANTERSVFMPWIFGASVVLLAQILSGGFVSSTFAGLSCPNLAGCQLPDHWSWDVFNPWREPSVNSNSVPVNVELALVHGLHRWLAGVTVLALSSAAMLLWRSGQLRLGLTLLLLTGTQIMLGVLLIDRALPLGVAVLHNLVAACLLALLLGALRRPGPQ